MKDKVARDNTTSVSLEEMRQRVLKAFSSITAEDCRKAVVHCKEIERKYYSYQQMVDSDIRPVIVTLEVSHLGKYFSRSACFGRS